jgi:hypothetical protein
MNIYELNTPFAVIYYSRIIIINAFMKLQKRLFVYFSTFTPSWNSPFDLMHIIVLHQFSRK